MSLHKDIKDFFDTDSPQFTRAPSPTQPNSSVGDASVVSDAYAQFYIANTTTSGGTADVEGAWKNYSGAGITVGIVDTGVQPTNAIPPSRYNVSAGYDYLLGRSGGYDPFNDATHGTMVASIIAGSQLNTPGIGQTSGIAYNAHIVSFPFIASAGGSVSTQELMSVIENQASVDVSNNSWGFTSAFAAYSVASLAQLNTAFQYAVGEGRHGLGTNIVFAAGNGGQTNDNTNYSPLLNSQYTIAVGAVDDTGTIASFSTPGSNVLVSAAGVNVIAPGLNNEYWEGSGTSFATPIVSGTIALMLQANPNLGYRDVQEILAASADQTDAQNASWQTNGATTWNGGGMHTSNEYGFGLVDATAAVRLAESWNLINKTPDTLSNEVTETLSSGTVNKTLSASAPITSTIQVSSALNIEHATVQLNFTDAKASDLVVQLISPHGTVSTLMNEPTTTGGYSSTWQLSTVQDWGENGVGAWTLSIKDAAGDTVTGLLSSWTLSLSGDAASQNNTYIYTNEYAQMTGARQTLSAPGGVQTLNLAAVTAGNTVNLNQGAQSIIAGNTMIIAQGTHVDNVILGDGNSTVIANTDGDQIFGGRGNDTYIFNGNNGNATITNPAYALSAGKQDEVLFGQNISEGNIAFALQSGNLMVHYDGNMADVVNIANFANTNYTLAAYNGNTLNTISDSSLNHVLQEIATYETQNHLTNSIATIEANHTLMGYIAAAW